MGSERTEFRVVPDGRTCKIVHREGPVVRVHQEPPQGCGDLRPKLLTSLFALQSLRDVNMGVTEGVVRCYGHGDQQVDSRSGSKNPNVSFGRVNKSPEPSG